MKKKRKLIFMLTALLAMAQGAWAQPTGGLTGKFTVDASGTTVVFSQGNLQATNTTANSTSGWTWKFATNQYDYIGNATANTSVGAGLVTTAGTVDLFGWVGASATANTTEAGKHGVHNTQAANNTTYGTSDTESLADDWGNLAITNGGNTANSGWKTLTSAQWTYLFNTRTTGGKVGNTSSARYTMATINTDVNSGVNGIILFPDGVDIANSTTYFKSLGTVNGTSSWGTECTSAQWTALESLGCVFLPAAGYRDGTTVVSAGSYGLYWSSSPNSSDGAGRAYSMDFYSGYVGPASNGNRCYGRLVRLVMPTSLAYTVTYDANGGSDAPSADTKYGEIPLTLSTDVPTRSFYTFAGWNTAADGTGTDYAAGATYSGNEDVTLYAQWTAGESISVTDGSGTFSMPAYNVEVTTELYYKLDETDDNSSYTTKSDVFLERTLKTGGWNTFCAPFDISASQVTALGMTVKQFTGATLDGTTLTLNFSDATEIAAGTPYLVKVNAALDLSAEGNEFEGVTQDWTLHTASGTAANFVPVLAPTQLTANDKSVLFVKGGNNLTYPNTTGNLNAFRAYFQLNGDNTMNAKSFVFNFDGEATGIRPINNGQLTIDNSSDATYNLAGQQVAQPTAKGVYIKNGKKIIK